MSLWIIECLAQKVCVEFSNDIQVNKLFGALFFDFQLTEAEVAEGVLLQVNQNAEGWELIDTKLEQSRQIQTKGDLVYFLSDKIIYHLIDRITIGHCIHAACVAKGEQAFVLPATSGSGKSSLSCWLVANGFEYISDELTIFLPSGKVSAISRPIQIKHHGIEVIKPLLQDQTAFLEGQYANAISAQALGGRSSLLKEWELGAFIFPNYQAEATFSYQTIKSAEVALQLMGTHVNARNVDSHGFRFMTELARRAEAFNLEYGGFDYLPRGFSSVIVENA